MEGDREEEREKVTGGNGESRAQTPSPTPPFSEIWCFCLGGLVLSQVAIA